MLIKKITGFFASLLLAIVYPNRLLNLLRVKNLDEKSSKILGNDKILKIVAFIAAFVYIVAVRYTPTTPTPSQFETTLFLQKRLDDNYTYFGSIIPETVDVILTGDSVELELFRINHLNDLVAFVDLNALEPDRTHDNVRIQIEGITGQIQATPVYGAISGIEIAQLEQREYQIRVVADLPEIAPDARYILGEYRVIPEFVTVIGPRILLDEIDNVRVNFDISDRDLSEEDYFIVYFEYPVPLSGLERVFGVDIYPSERVEIRVQVIEDLRSIIFELDTNLLNAPVTRYNITSVTADISEIEVWGDFANLADWERDHFDETTGIFKLPRISIRDLDDNGQYTFTIPFPASIYTEIDDEEIVTEIEIVVTVEYEEIPTEATESTEPTTPTTRNVLPTSMILKKSEATPSMI